MLSMRYSHKERTSSIEPSKPKPSTNKCVKVNPVDFLQIRDFNNKYCFGVHAINDIKKKAGHSPTTVKFLMTVLVGSKAARGTTADQITQALSSTNSRDLESECANLVDQTLAEWALLSTAGLADIPTSRMEEERLCQFHTALFVPRVDFEFKAEFQWLVTNRMGVEWIRTSRKDFHYAQRWVSKISKGRFVQTFPKPSTTSMVLATALQFKGKWLQQPELCGSSKGSFEVSSTDKIDIPMLRVTTKVIYYKDMQKGFHLVGIPFRDTRFAIAFLLPLIPHTFMEVEHQFNEGLDYDLFNNPKLQFCSMRVIVPMFRLQTEVDLCKALPFLGVKDPFDSDRADFSGIGDADKLHIDAGKESALLKVSRSGVRVLSVATFNLTTNHNHFRHPDLFEVPNLKALGVPEVKENRSFIVNQPFSVMLIDRESDSVIYQGRVKIPEPLTLSKSQNGSS